MIHKLCFHLVFPFILLYPTCTLSSNKNISTSPSFVVLSSVQISKILKCKSHAFHLLRRSCALSMCVLLSIRGSVAVFAENTEMKSNSRIFFAWMTRHGCLPHYFQSLVISSVRTDARTPNPGVFNLKRGQQRFQTSLY